MNQQYDLYHQQDSRPINNHNIQQVTNMLINYIRKLKNDYKRDKLYLTNLTSKNQERMKKATSTPKNSNNNENIDKIKAFEEEQKQKVQINYLNKEHKREIIHNQYLENKLEKLLIQKEKNEIKTLKSKIYLEQSEAVYNSKYNEFTQKDKKIKDKINEAIKQKQFEIQQRSNLHNFKLKEANERYLNHQQELDQRAAQVYYESLFSNSANSKNQKDVKPNKSLDLDKLNKIQKEINEKQNEIKEKIAVKDQKYKQSLEIIKEEKNKENLYKRLAFEDKYQLALKNKKDNQSKFNQFKQSIYEKESKVNNYIQERKRDQEVRILLKKEIDEMKQLIRLKLDQIVSDRKILSSDEIKNALYNILPGEFLENKQIIEEINSIDDGNEMNKEGKHSINHKYIDNQTFYTPKSASNDLKSSPEYYEQMEIKLNKEILDLIAFEKCREEERINILNKETSKVKLKELNSIFNEERLKASNKLIEKQKEKENLLAEHFRNKKL